MLKIAYFSPFSPDPSGVSDFSEELVVELKRWMEVDLFSRIPPEKLDICNQFNCYEFASIEKEGIREQYDFLVYQVGNNIKYHKGVIDTFLKYPGILEIHDFSMHYYLAEDTYIKGDYQKYIEIIKYCHGSKGEEIAKSFLEGRIPAPWETHSESLSVNKHLIDKALAVIVHSDMAKQMVKAIRPDVRVINIPLHTSDLHSDYENLKRECKKKLNITDDTLVMGSFGYANPSKRIVPTLKALALLKNSGKDNFYYYIVGKVQNIDIDEILQQLNLKENVIVTSFVSLEDFKTYMGACDFCFNLRYPTQGESSASLHRMLGMGKPAVVTDIGTFEEYSEKFVIKVSYDTNEVNEIYNAISVLSQDKELLEQMSEKAYLYATENCSLLNNAKRYNDFFIQLLNNTYAEEYLDLLLDRLYLLGVINDKNYIRYFLDKNSGLLELEMK